MTGEERRALREIRGYAAANRIVIVGHAWRRLRERGATYGDVRHALTNAQSCQGEVNERFRVTGDDLDGDELTCIVVVEGGDIVVTVF